MPTLTHESLVNRFRVRPALAVDLLRTTFAVAVPDFERVSVAEADATEAVPMEFRADLVVELWARDARRVGGGVGLACDRGVAGPRDVASGRAYFLMLKRVLKPALRALIERLMIEKTPYGEFEVPAWLHKAEQAARDEGRARSILTVLSTRGLVPTDAERAKVLACRDERRLERWLRKAVTARAVAAVLEPARPTKK